MRILPCVLGAPPAPLEPTRGPPFYPTLGKILEVSKGMLPWPLADGGWKGHWQPRVSTRSSEAGPASRSDLAVPPLARHWHTEPIFPSVCRGVVLKATVRGGAELWLPAWVETCSGLGGGEALPGDSRCTQAGR